MKVARGIATPIIPLMRGGEGAPPVTTANTLIWASGNNLIWASGNNLIWGTS